MKRVSTIRQMLMFSGIMRNFFSVDAGQYTHPSAQKREDHMPCFCYLGASFKASALRLKKAGYDLLLYREDK